MPYGDGVAVMDTVGRGADAVPDLRALTVTVRIVEEGRGVWLARYKSVSWTN